MNYDLEANKQNAIAFYRTAYLGDPAKCDNGFFPFSSKRKNYRALGFNTRGST